MKLITKKAMIESKNKINEEERTIRLDRVKRRIFKLRKSKYASDYHSLMLSERISKS